MMQDESRASAFMAAGAYRNPFGSPTRQAAIAIAATLLVILIWSQTGDELMPVMLALGAIGVLLSLRRPELVAAVLLFLTYFKISDISPHLQFFSPITTLAAAMTLGAALWSILVGSANRIELRGPVMAVIVLWLLLTVGGAVSRDRSLALEEWNPWSKVLVLTFAAMLVMRTEEHLRMIARVFAIGGVVISIATIANVWSGVELVENSRAVGGKGTLGNPNDLALILLFPLCLALTLALPGSKPLDRALGIVATILIVYAIVVCRSRGALLGTVAASVVVANQYVKSKALIASVGAVLVVGLYVGMDFSTRSSGGSLGFDDESAQGRLDAWRAGINMAISYPLTGVGIGNFHAQHLNFSPGGSTRSLTAHSIWFLILGEGGIPAILAFVAFTGSLLMLALQNMRTLMAANASFGLQAISLATVGGFVGYLVAGSFLSYAYQWPLYVFLLFSIVLSRLAKDVTDAKPGAGISPR